MAAVAVTSGLAACAGMYWSPLQFQGPLIEGNKRARSFISCDDRPMGISDSHYCVVAVEDHTGRKVNTDDIGESVNMYLGAIPQLAAWAPDARGNGHGSYGFPYTLHLVTISPVVVMAVPHGKGDIVENFNGGRDGGIVVRALQEEMRYRNPPPIRAGSFLFSPDLKIASREISAYDSRVELPLGTSVLVLTADDGVWKITRDSSR
jgi:hypothetical protein